MRNPLFKGAGTAIVTPFNETGINFDALKDLIEFQIEGGIDSIVVCGTTGEASTMPDEEHLEAVKFTCEVVNKRVPVIAGAGSNDTKHAIYLSKKCEELGADAILSVTPYYNKTSQAGLVKHFNAIADSLSIPVLLYNVPSRTSVNIEPETMAILAENQNIVGVKECQFDQLLKAKSLCPDDFYFYSGNDNQVLPLLSLGGLGVISVVGNIAPGRVSKMVKDFLSGNIEEAIKTQVGSRELIDAMFMDVNPIPVKEALNLMGINAGPVRLPLVPLSDKDLETLKKTLKDYGLTK